MFPFYTPLETPENLWFSGVFRRYKMGKLARNWLMSHYKLLCFSISNDKVIYRIYVSRV